MNAALRNILKPGVRGPIAIALGLGLLIGFVVGVFAVRDPEHTYLLRAIRDSVTDHSCSGWAEEAERQDQNDAVYRAVAQALIDWDSTGGRTPGS